MAEKFTHEEMHEHGIEHTHEVHNHEQEAVPHSHTHGHTHSHTHTKEVLNRLARAAGHLEKVRSMVENGEDCTEVLIQLAAVKSALNNTGKVILKDHVEHCMVHAVEENDTHAIEELNKAIDRFIK